MSWSGFLLKKRKRPRFSALKDQKGHLIAPQNDLKSTFVIGIFKNQLYIRNKWLCIQLWSLKKISWFQLILISRFLIWLMILPFLAKILMWGVFPTQFLSLNLILLSESRNSKKSVIFWNLWNLSANTPNLFVLPKWGTFPTQIKAPDLILMSKRWNLQNFTDLESWFQWFQNKFQIAGIS